MSNQRHDTRRFAFGDGTIGRRNIWLNDAMPIAVGKAKTPVPIGKHVGSRGESITVQDRWGQGLRRALRPLSVSE